MKFTFCVVSADDYNNIVGAASNLTIDTPATLAREISHWQRKINDSIQWQHDLPTVWNSNGRVFVLAANDIEAVIVHKAGYE